MHACMHRCMTPLGQLACSRLNASVLYINSVGVGLQDSPARPAHSQPHAHTSCDHQSHCKSSNTGSRGHHWYRHRSQHELEITARKPTGIKYYCIINDSTHALHRQCCTPCIKTSKTRGLCQETRAPDQSGAHSTACSASKPFVGRAHQDVTLQLCAAQTTHGVTSKHGNGTQHRSSIDAPLYVQHAPVSILGSTQVSCHSQHALSPQNHPMAYQTAPIPPPHTIC
jgi:hypothetical protein